MKLNIITTVLDGMPWVSLIWPELTKLNIEWQWHIIEGVSAPDHCTKWCSNMAPRLSEDGTSEYLDSIASVDTRISIYRKELWHGKRAMYQEPLRYFYEPCILFQMDSDELWTSGQIEKIHNLFRDNPKKNCAYFYCDFRVGPGIRITSRGGFGNNTSYEWIRAWKFSPGMKFESHEPPKLVNFKENPFTHEDTEKEGLVFRHEAYSCERQVKFKEQFYGSSNNDNGALYKSAVNRWRRLQNNRKWPVNNLSDFLPWVGQGVTADRV